MKDMLTAKELQELLHVDRSTIYRMAEAGQLPAMKVGKQWRFPQEQVQAWLSQQSSSPVASTPVVKERPFVEPAVASAPGLDDLLPHACVQLLQDSYADLLGVMLVITDMQGNPVTTVSNPCGLFAAINDQPDAVQKCIQSWHTLGAALDFAPQFMTSHLGMLCARGLIRVGTELKGMVVAGCIAPDVWPPAPEEVARMAAELGVAPELIEAKVNEVHTLSEVEQQQLLRFLPRIAHIVAHIVNERYAFVGRLAAIADLTQL